ncbi:cation diffusion facilitator family transporter [Arsukibacterium sp.]|uniref:cation diffusion facilitator family transporter n=1 Tax=Arsukibacterium sp. TaxID=1977258 RepID=UPI00299F1F43|nr:cation diffusion facilitator family transporter [Arsukibacterium sp.]MDX1676410.1 cation diffusion facilitator family transporter [Arsukibacterium sp.]
MLHWHHHGTENHGDLKLIIAVAVNVLLTTAQVIGGVLSGSLSLIADALHNLSDAASLGIALFARKISRKPANELKTFGYKRAEVIAALINLTTLIIVGLYLIYEALWRFAKPEEIAGWTVVIVAGLALLVDIITALLTYTMSKNSMNIRAAFIHNLSDALASVAVIIAGTLILLYQWYWVDTLLTLLIAGYILWQGFTMLPKAIHLLMEGTPAHISIPQVISAMTAVDGVANVHHLHIWQLDEQHNALEAHVVVKCTELQQVEKIKTALKTLLSEQFNVGHSTLEFEHARLSDCDELVHEH